MWRFAALLPDAPPVTLGEGATPLLPSRDNPKLLIKNEGINPAGSVEARGLSLAVTMASAAGQKQLAIASTGNGAGALAAYAAAAGSQANIFMPGNASPAAQVLAESHGARITRVQGTIGDGARLLGESKRSEGWLDLSAFQEPFRLEGKKTLVFEIAEQLAWTLPAAIVYPTALGSGPIALWKGLEEMDQFGWLPAGSPRPKMILVQPAGCAPIVQAWEQGQAVASLETTGGEMRAPGSPGSRAALDLLHRSGGAAVAVSDDEILDAWRTWSRREGLLAAPAGAMALAGYRKLLHRGFLSAEETTILVNTASGYAYIDTMAAWNLPPKDRPGLRRIGGIIQPY
jgi:threonine synthase